MDKPRLREEARARRAELDGEVRAAATAAVNLHLRQLPALLAADTVLAYAAHGDELDVSAVITDLVTSGTRVLLPRVVGGRLELARVTDLAALTLGYRGVREPVGPAVAPEDVDVALVPGVAFDRSGGRLGQGGGHYDRLLPELRPTVPRIAPCFAIQVVERVPRETHDHVVDLLVTEDGASPTGAR